MANYDDVIEKNRRYLTKAQVNALVAASKEYNVQNAGKRASALASAREQYDVGYRGLQNMGLASGVNAAPTSGEVPRLKTQLQVPFEDYNRRLREVENKRLNALGGAFAQQTQQAQAAAAQQAAAAKAAQEEAMRQAQLRAAAELQTRKNEKTALTRVINNNRPTGAKGITSSDLTTPKLYDEPYEAPQKPVTREQTVNSALSAGMKQAVSTPSPQLIAAAQMLGISSPANKVVNKVTNALSPVLNQKTGVAHTDDERDIANNILQATKDNLSKGFDMDQAQKDLEAAQKKVDALASARDTSARPGAEDAYQQAVQQRDVAKLKVEDPKTYSYMVVANSNADPATKRMAGTKFIEEKFTDDAEDAALKYKSAKETASRMEAELNKGKEGGPSIDEVNNAIDVYYSAVKAYEDTAGHGAPSAASREPIDKANKMLNDLGFKSIYAAERYRDSLKNTKEPEALTKARDNLAAAELRYKDPDTYRALQMLPYKDLLKQTNPDVVEWAEEKAADYQLKSMGIKTRGMSDEEYEAAKNDIKGINATLRKIESAQFAYDNAGEAETEDVVSDKEHAKEDLDAAVRELQDKYGMTYEEAKAFTERFETEKDARLEYDYYKDGMVALLDHNGEKPENPVNTEETDPTYRKVNGLSNITMAATEYEGADASKIANFMTQGQKDAYNAIYEKDGIEAADKYFKDITPILNIQRAMQDEAYYKKLADEHPILADLRSVGASLLWNMPAAIERIAHGAVNLFTDKYYDTKSDLSYRSARADIIRSVRSQNILSNMSRPDWVNNVLNFAYQTGMSMADSGVAMTFAYAGAPWMVDALFFSSAGNSAYKEARERGATQAQAMEVGILSGTAEALFEHASIEHFMKLDYKGKGALIKNLLAQSFVEGSEEVSTELANAITDAWVMRDKSKYNVAVKEYESQGMTHEQAQNKAFLDQLADIGMAGIGGFVSGGLFALGGAAVSSVQYNKEGKRLSQNTQAKDRIIQLAEIMGGDAQEALDAYNADQTNRNLGELSATVQKNMQEMFGKGKEVPDVSKAATMSQQQNAIPMANAVTTGNQMDLDAAVRNQIIDQATAYSAMLSGDKMVAATAQTILDVLGAEKLQSMGYDTSSTMKLMSSYNKRLDQYNIQSRADALANRTFEPIRSGYQSQLRQTPSLMGATRAGSALTQTQERATAANVTRAENMAVNRVWENPTQGLAQTVNGRTITPMPGNLTAVSLAEQQRNNFKANATATAGKVTYAVAGMQAREGMSNEQTLSEIKKSLTKEARAKADFYEKLSKALGLKMTIHDVMVGTNGFIDENGNMHVVLSGKQSVLRVAAHELTHYMKENATGHYAEMRKYLIADVGQEKFDRMIKQKAREYGIDLSTEKGRTIADDEVCAELCERMLSDTDAIERFAEKNTAAAKTLKDHLVKILNAIKAALKDAKNRDFGESWSDMVTEQETIDKWITGLDAAIQNAEKRAQTNEGQIGKVAGTTITDQNELIDDIKKAKTDAEVDEAFAEHSVDIIEHDLAGYRQDLVNAGIMTNEELDELFDTMNKAVDKVKAHRAILDFGFHLSEEAQNDPELAEKEIAEAKSGRAYLPYKQNADPHYKLALDFSTLCKKRILLQMIQERLQGKLGRALSALETIAVRREIQKLQKNGVDVEVACALCYVEAARLKSPKVINEFLGVDQTDRTSNVEAEMKNYFAQKDKDIKKDIEKAQKQWKVDKLGADWRGTDKKGRTITAEKATKDQLKAFGGQVLVDEFNKYSKDLRTGNLVSDALKKEQQAVIDEAKRLVQESPETFLSAESLAKLKKSNPDIFYAFTNKVRSATRSKALETDTFYSRGDIDMVEEAIVRAANQESGFRHQSWSDFMPIHLLDTMASVIEMSQRGAKMHAYTKVPEMVRLLGNTGMMLNLSLIPTGQTGLVDGRLDFDSTEGMDFDTMMELRDMFPNTVGNIAIGISDDQIKKLLQSDDIDYVIPYHVSGLNKQLRTHMGIHTWLDFTSSQNESAVSKEWEDKHKKSKMKPPALAAWFDEKAAKAAGSNGIEYMQQAAQKYLDICARDGWVPKFSQYLDYDAKANKYTPKAGYENYWKTLTDRKMVNQKTGEVIIQQAVKPKFDQATVMDILNGEAENPTAIRNAAAADEIANELGKTWRADKENANLKSYKDELNAFREASAVMAADRVKEQVKRELEKAAQESGTRHDLDTDELLDILGEEDNGVRYSIDAKKNHRTAVEGETKYKPAGRQPRVRDVQVPRYANTGKPVSDFVRSFLESDKATDEMVADLQEKIANGEWGSYTRLTNKEAMATAQNFVANRTLSKAQEEFHDMVKSGRYNVQTRAIGLQLLAEAAQRGDSEAVLNIATDLRELATDAGQSVQIFNVLKGLGGVGSAWYMQKKIDSLNAKYADRISSGKMNEITVSKELMQNLMDAKTTVEVEAAEDEIAKEIAKQLPLTWESRISNWRYLAMLANPTTHFRNITGNVFMAGMNMTKDAVAATIERFAVRDESKRAHALLTLKDRQTWGDFAESSYKDQKNALAGNGKFGFETQLRQYMRAFDTKWLNKIAQFNFDKLEKEDMDFIRPAYKNALMQYMKAQGFQLKNGVPGKMVDGKFKEATTEQMNAAREWASQQAWKATFHDASVVADMLNSASKKLGPVGNVLIEGVMPFKKTPINIAKRGIEYSPAGIIMGAVQLMKDVKTGKVTVADAIDNIASGITGTSLMALGAFLAKMGLLRAGGDDKKKKETYLTDTGDQTYSLKIGKYSIGLSALAPATIPLFIGAALYDSLDKNGEGIDLSAITETAANALNPFMEMSFMSSLNSALKNYNQNGIGGALGNTLLTAAQSYGSQFLPTAVSKVGQFFDPTVRTTKSSAASKVGSNLDYYGRSLAKKVPGLEATLQPDVNVWGRTTKKGNILTKDGFFDWALDFANKFIFPAYVKVANKDKVDDELIRVVESTGDVDVLPSDGPKYFTVKGEKYPMTAAEYTEYSQERGTASYAALKETMSADSYWDATDEEKATMLSNALTAAQKHVDTVWKEKLGAIEPAKEETAEEKPKTEVQATDGEYSDPALYKVAASYPKAYDKAAKANAKGISPDTFLDLYEKKDTYSGDDLSTYTREEIMKTNLTTKQKEFMDDLIVSDKGWNPDYSSQAWFEASMLGNDSKTRQKHYEEAKEGAKIGLKPETYVQVYNKWKSLSGNTKQHDAKAYLDSLTITAPVYDYLWYTVFGYTKHPSKVK